MIEGAHVLITGGAGFIGSHLVERLCGKNRIRVLDTFRRDALRPAGLHEKPNVELVEGDVMDLQSVKMAMDGIDHVIHLASIAGVDTVMKQPALTMRISLLGTANVLDASLETGKCKRFIDFSTSEVFGRYAYHVTEFDVTTLGAVGEARWTYAVAKLATEHLAMTYHKQFDFPACSIRPLRIAHSTRLFDVRASRQPRSSHWFADERRSPSRTDSPRSSARIRSSSSIAVASSNGAPTKSSCKRAVSTRGSWRSSSSRCRHPRWPLRTEVHRLQRDLVSAT